MADKMKRILRMGRDFVSLSWNILLILVQHNYVYTDFHTVMFLVWLSPFLINKLNYNLKLKSLIQNFITEITNRIIYVQTLLHDKNRIFAADAREKKKEGGKEKKKRRKGKEKREERRELWFRLYNVLYFLTYVN